MTWLCKNCVQEYDSLAFEVLPKEEDTCEDCGELTDCVDYNFEEGDEEE